MIPLQVTLEGFLSYEKKQVLNFVGASIWALSGPNSVGKSAVFDAMTFALYHRARCGPKDLIHHRADRLIVSFDFMVDGTIYRVKRIHPRKGRSTREAFIVDSADGSNLDSAPTKRIANTDSDDELREWVKRTIGMDYVAFTSSCLLLQGKSEQLLDVDPGDRYAILAELMDLSRYEQLCKAAEDKRKAFKNAVETLEKQLLSPTICSISDVELEEAQQQLLHAETVWQDTQANVERFSGYLEQARHWEMAVMDLQKQQVELEDAQELLDRDVEITNGFSELQELHDVLPALSQIVKGRASLLILRTHLDELQHQSRRIEEDVCIAKSKKDAEQQVVTDLECAVKHREKESTQYLLRLAVLSPLVSKSEQIEQLQAKKAELDAQLAGLSVDIARQVEQAEQRLKALKEKGHTWPWLSTFARERAGLGATLERERMASTAMMTLRERYEELRESRTLLHSAFTQAQEAEQHLYGEERSSNTRLQDAKKRQQKFAGVVTKPVCDLCGQGITGEHARQEKMRLQQTVDECTRDVTNVAQQYREATRLKQAKEKELAALDDQIGTVKTSYGQAKHDQQTAYERAELHTNQLRAAFGTMGELYQRQIIGAIPEDRAVWLETVYPTQSDIDTMQQEASEEEAQAREVARLRDVHNMWQPLNQQSIWLNRQISEQEQVLDINAARDARTEKNVIEEKQNALTALGEEQQQRLEQAREVVQETNDALKALNTMAQQCQGDIRAETGRGDEMERVQREREASLSVQWQSRANALDEIGLIALELRHTDLSGYRSLYEQLTGARESVERCQERIRGLEVQILVYPSEAKQPVKEVEEVLVERKQAHQQAGGERDRLNGNLTRLKEQRKLRQELVQQKLADERIQHLYAVLTKHLGKSGLQLYLLSRAERAIVNFANQTLSGLSHGRMRLELRRESDTQAQADKALDLVVYDREIGNHAVPIGSVSGSQKFRIAVSLALSIGRYMSREGRHLESVIIDEGFGGLDKAGRDDMIQELHALGQQVARIILVSHQEEFAYAFPNRYRFKLVDGSSRVTLMDEE